MMRQKLCIVQLKEEDVKYAAEAISDLVKSGEANRADKSGKSGKNVPRERYDGARRPGRIRGQYRTVALGIANEIATNGRVILLRKNLNNAP